jgi:hypothetical protein
LGSSRTSASSLSSRSPTRVCRSPVARTKSGIRPRCTEMNMWRTRPSPTSTKDRQLHLWSKRPLLLGSILTNGDLTLPSPLHMLPCLITNLRRWQLPWPLFIPNRQRATRMTRATTFSLLLSPGRINPPPPLGSQCFHRVFVRPSSSERSPRAPGATCELEHTDWRRYGSGINRYDNVNCGDGTRYERRRGADGCRFLR